MLTVAIDGPAGAGKSTVARRLAERLGIGYLDTGAMYRAVTWAALERGLQPNDDPDNAALAEVARATRIDIGRERILVDDVEVTAEIRSPRVNENVSAVSANSEVRTVLVRLQRDWVRSRGGGVLEGRDIGSVVLPDATAKFFVTASPRVRAMRRVGELGGDVDEIERAIAERDAKDSNRADSPLLATSDMIVVDTSDLSIDEVVAEIAELVLARANGAKRGQTSEARTTGREAEGHR